MENLQKLGVAGRSILVIILSLAAYSCASIGKTYEPPRINLANIKVQEISGLETVFQIHLRVFNTNDVDLEIKGVECVLELNERAFATGVSNTPVKIPAYGTETIPVVVYSSVIKMFRGIYGMQNREDLSYRLKGKVRLAGGAMVPPSLPFESEGSVSLTDLAPPKK